MSDNREYKWKQMPRFSMKCEFPVLTQKQKGKSINCRIVFVVIPRAPVYRIVFTKKYSKFSTLKSHTIKCVTAELGRAGWEIFGFRS